MKILYSCLSKSWGGMEMYTLTSVKQLQKQNITVELLCIENSRLHVEANSIGIIIHPIKAGGYIHPLSIVKTVSIIKNSNYSIIHSQASKDLWILVPALSILKSNVLLFFTKHVGSGIVKKDFLHKFLYNRVNKLFAISNLIKTNLVETCPVNPDGVVVLPNGVDVDLFNSENVDINRVRNEFRIDKDEIIIGMIARFTPGKGHEELFRAVNELNKNFSNLKCLIVGEASRGEEEYMRKIKQLAADLSLKNIIFTGYRSDIPATLAAMDIFVFPSHSEAFGIALIEAMAMEKPSVCTNSDGVLDIAIDNYTSLLFERKNHRDLIEKLKALLESKQLRIKLGANARKHVLKNFSLKNVTQKAIEHYNNELGKQN